MSGVRFYRFFKALPTRHPNRPLTWGGGLPMDPGSAMADDTASVAVLRNELFDEISTQETPAAAV